MKMRFLTPTIFLVLMFLNLAVYFFFNHFFFNQRKVYNYFFYFCLFFGCFYGLSEVNIQDEIRKTRIFLNDLSLSEKEKEIILSKKVRKNLSSGVPAKKLSYILVIACETGNFRIAEHLIGYGLPVNEKFGGTTALIQAVKHGNTAFVKRLLEKGADLKIKDDHGNTALKLAEKFDHKEIVNFLSYLSR